MLEAFRDQDPNGNGLKDEVPYFARQWEEVLRLLNLWDARSSGSDTYHDFYVNDEGKIVHPYAQEAYRDGLANIAQWYKEGLIDPEIFTRGSSSRDYLLGENLGGATHDWFASTSGYNAALADKIEGFNFIPFLPPASARRCADGRTSPHPDQAGRLGDQLYQQAPGRDDQVLRLLVHARGAATLRTSASRARPGTWSTASRSTSPRS